MVYRIKILIKHQIIIKAVLYWWKLNNSDNEDKLKFQLIFSKLKPFQDSNALLTAWTHDFAYFLTFCLFLAFFLFFAYCLVLAYCLFFAYCLFLAFGFLTNWAGIYLGDFKDSICTEKKMKFILWIVKTFRVSII